MLTKFIEKRIDEAGTTSRLRDMLQVLRRREIMSGMTPVKLRQIFEDLGPTYVKLGQILSMRPDFLPPEYCEELMKLQSDANPLPFDTVLEVIDNQYSQPWKKVFKYIDEEALGSASMAQVHRAILTTGEKVVIKVQRPGTFDVMSKDIVLLKRAASLLKVVSHSQDVVDMNLVLDELWTIAKQEMDFNIEADHFQEFENLNRDVDYVAVPRVYRSLCTSQILVMEYIDGIPIDHIDELKEKGYNVTDLGRKLGENYVKQIIDDGVFHADPHPGNILVRNGKIVWLDLGMVGRLTNRDRSSIRKAIMALAHHDPFEMKDAVLALGIARGSINHTKLYQDIDMMMTQYSTLDFNTLQMGVLSQQIMNILRVHKLAVPQGLSMFCRGVMTIESVLRVVCPDVSFVEILAKNLSMDFRRNFSWREEMDKAKRETYLLLRKTSQLPEQISDLVKMTMGGQTKMNLEVTGSDETLAKVNRMINKLIIAMLCAALLVGSSTLCTTDMQPKIMEIPLLGLFGYLIAAVLSIRLIWEIHKGGM